MDKFYDRKEELALLKELKEQSLKESRMVVLTGRRRVGKTLLALESSKTGTNLYFFISRKSEALLCQDFLSLLKNIPGIPVFGEIKSFITLFEILMQVSENNPLTLIIDEFQEFYQINPSVYSEMQKLWDLKKKQSKMNLILIGSIYSLMNKIFQDEKEPLFGRADRMIQLKAFRVSTIREVLKDRNEDSPSNIFLNYFLTGGLPRYIDIFVSNHIYSLNSMIDFVFQSSSPFLQEGNTILIEEFGRDYTIYFSILELIAVGRTARTEMESVLGKTIGGYLDRLENDFGMIRKVRPITAKVTGRTMKYEMVDNFLCFWFRYIYRYKSAVEMNNFNYLKEAFEADYTQYAGKMLERFYRDIFAESSEYNRIGSFWDRSSENEIDLVAVNDRKKTLVIAEIKLNADKIKLNILKKKAEVLLPEFPGYKAEYLGLSLDNIQDYLG